MPAPVAPAPVPPGPGWAAGGLGPLGPPEGERAAAAGPPEGSMAGPGGEAAACWSPRRKLASSGDRQVGLAESEERAEEEGGAERAMWGAAERRTMSVRAARADGRSADAPKPWHDLTFCAMEVVLFASEAGLEVSWGGGSRSWEDLARAVCTVDGVWSLL